MGGSFSSTFEIVNFYLNQNKQLTYNNKRIYGWKRQLPDQRDHYIVFNSNNNKLNCIDLRDNCPDIYNQGNLGSCTANGIAFAYQYVQIKQKIPNFVPSRLFIYYNERYMEGTVNYDSGANIRDGIKSINKQGICDEKEWVYDISKFTDKPTNQCYIDAKKNLSVKYKQIPQNIEQFKLALTEGFPIVFGFSVYESFESEIVSKTGIVPIPKLDEKLLGGHCVCIVGFIEDKSQFIVRNSWGKNWGDKGYCYFPYEYLENYDLSNDFWIIEQVEDKE